MNIAASWLDRHGYGDAGAMAGGAGDCQLPAQYDHALLYAQQSEGLLAARRVDVEPDAVVLDVEPDALGVVIEQDLDVACVRMPGHIRQRFLNDSEQHDAPVLAHRDVAVYDADRATDSASLLELLDQPLHSREDTEVERGRPQGGRDAPHDLDDGIDPALQFLHLFPDLGRRFAELQGQEGKIHLERSQGLAQLVVDFARDMRSEEHTSELQSLTNLVCRLLLEKKKKNTQKIHG